MTSAIHLFSTIPSTITFLSYQRPGFVLQTFLWEYCSPVNPQILGQLAHEEAAIGTTKASCELSLEESRLWFLHLQSTSILEQKIQNSRFTHFTNNDPLYQRQPLVAHLNSMDSFSLYDRSRDQDACMDKRATCYQTFTLLKRRIYRYGLLTASGKELIFHLTVQVQDISSPSGLLCFPSLSDKFLIWCNSPVETTTIYCNPILSNSSHINQAAR